MTSSAPDRTARTRTVGVVAAVLLVIALVLLYLRANGLPPFAPGTDGDRSGPAGPVLRMTGSGTIGERLAPDLAEAYLRGRGASDVRRESTDSLVTVLGTLPGQPQPTRFEISTSGTSDGFADIGDGGADVVMASRRITEPERAGLTDLGDLTSRESEHVLALDAVAVIVNRDRGVGALSVDQLRGVFTCTITDWRDLGQPAGPISVLALQDGSGTLDTFRGVVLGESPLCPTARRVDGVEEISRAVAADPSAISFVGLPFVGGNRVLPLYAGGAQPLEPSQLSVSTESYLLTRRLYLYLPTRPAVDPLARDFVESFALAPDGQRLVDAAGFVSPLFPPAPPAPPPCTAELPEYCALVQGAERVPFDVRFDAGTDRVDNRAFRNLDLFAAQLRDAGAGDRRPLLVGFADNTGTDQANLELSRNRAATVARELAARGVAVEIATDGFGEALPVDTNDTPAGKEQNRRVEVWLR